MSLTASWTRTFDTSAISTLANVQVMAPVPVGSVLAMAISRGGASLLSSLTSMKGNNWQIHGSGSHSSNTLTIALATMVVTTALDASDTFNVTYPTTANRWAMAFGVFDGLVEPITSVQMPGIVSTAAIPVNAGPTPTRATNRSLVLTAASTTEAGWPIINLGNKIASSVLTAGASANRGVALLYKHEGGHQHTGSFTLGASVISASTSVAFDANPLPPGTLPVMTVDGEVPGRLSKWTGSAEVLATGLGVAP